MTENRRISPDLGQDFLALSALDFVDVGKLIWKEETMPYSHENIITGPFLLLTPWCQSLFGPEIGLKEPGYWGKIGVKCLNSITGYEISITHGTLLVATYFAHKDDLI
tara:strand:- start:1536 stop:1859 length:324 start_codon:yes stop_codon:yes gene_type:complete